MSLVGTLIGLGSGALGGNLGGAIMKKASMGPLWNSVVGILGGGLGATILNFIPGMDVSAAGETLNASSILGSVGSGAVGGGVLMTIIGFIKGAMKK